MRIITGKAKGKVLTAPEGLETRPTLDRVKEALFGSIQFEVEGAAVLDLFSGSGNIGLEAASRGARKTVMNDHSPAAVSCIRRNTDITGLSDHVEILQKDFRDCVRFLACRGDRFDFVFIDAPFRTGLAAEAAGLVFSEGILNPGGSVFVEHASDDVPVCVPELYEIKRTRRYGASSFSLLKRSNE
ncbi:MAG: 16S rRNA (guanine(966)-N(2))-methyltransferase RsmD [Clostridia bacterium]|nr:16S rRNA (guanine(966)-N(2))-methyltransferase RsmD [Clostridia bacterium]MBQ3663880.1 16S rRNA (guanine(966)-N(2))-methyltransferase RsmD [Clostridia bacterium]MBQ5757609.1 16S rRNA (guanine(966)-N(2))-methyltransferase RsmD [Clostridia bacterium]